MDTGAYLSTWLGVAVLLPLASFFAILIFANWMGRSAAHLAVAAIGGACLLSFLSLFVWLRHNWPPEPHHAHAAGHDAGHEKEGPTHDKADDGEHKRAGIGSDLGLSLVAHLALEESKEDGREQGTKAAGDTSTASSAAAKRGPYAGEYYLLGKFGDLRLNISYYIDSLTICMFCMVTLIATLIHIYAIGYMHDELHDVTDHEVATSSGDELKRPGRYPRFFQYLSLFCFSMLGLVLSGNIAMVFVFWELVGI
ncbi:MAG TPA: NADH-quinone oxidoreductase subunit L, partial [Pirellulaceae bacterium]|nr:NADH-quinone oxidoreductase subunit L [Pirellulaceae bacterium]